MRAKLKEEAHSAALVDAAMTVQKQQKKPPLVYTFRMTFAFAAFTDYAQDPEQRLYENGYTLMDRIGVAKVFRRADDYLPFAVLVEKSDQDYLILVESKEAYIAFARNNLTLGHIIEEILPAPPCYVN